MSSAEPTEPAEGRLDLTATEPCRVAVRLPAGVAQAFVLIDTNDAGSLRAVAPRAASHPGPACVKPSVARLLPAMSAEVVGMSRV